MRGGECNVIHWNKICIVSERDWQGQYSISYLHHCQWAVRSLRTMLTLSWVLSSLCSLSPEPDLIVQFVLIIFAAYPGWAGQMTDLAPVRPGARHCQPCHGHNNEGGGTRGHLGPSPDQPDMGKWSVTVLANYYKQWPPWAPCHCAPCHCPQVSLSSRHSPDMGTVLFLTFCINSKSADIFNLNAGSGRGEPNGLMVLPRDDIFELVTLIWHCVQSSNFRSVINNSGGCLNHFPSCTIIFVLTPWTIYKSNTTVRGLCEAY